MPVESIKGRGATRNATPTRFNLKERMVEGEWLDQVEALDGVARRRTTVTIEKPRSILTRIPGLRMVPFNVRIPRETGEMTGYWVPQGSPKPLTSGTLDTITLDFNKVAGITYLTQELLRFSTPSAETLMVNSLTAALTKLVDNDFLDHKSGNYGYAVFGRVDSGMEVVDAIAAVKTGNKGRYQDVPTETVVIESARRV